MAFLGREVKKLNPQVELLQEMTTKRELWEQSVKINKQLLWWEVPCSSFCLASGPVGVMAACGVMQFPLEHNFTYFFVKTWQCFV